MILLWLSLLVLFLDRVTKLAVVSKMTEGESIPVFENIFHLTYVLNPGAAFGMLPHNRTFFLVIGILALGFSIVMTVRLLRRKSVHRKTAIAENKL